MRQPWFKLAVFYWMDPKFSGLGPIHEALYARLLGYTVAHNTAGLIPGNAIALCGRGIRSREKRLRDMVRVGLLLETADPEHPFAFPTAWGRWQDSALPVQRQRSASAATVQQQRSASAQEIAGQAGRLVRTGGEERRDILEVTSSTLPPASPVPEDMQAALDRIHSIKWGQTNGSHAASTNET